MTNLETWEPAWMDEPRDARVVGDIYRAGAGLAPWSRPLDAIAGHLSLWVATLITIDRATSTVRSSHEGGGRAPEITRDWICRYHRIDPRAALVASGPTGHWIACDERFDDAYVAKHPFFQEFLLPRGGRYVYGAKIAEDANERIVIAFSRARGSPQLNAAERAVARGWSRHVLEALRMQAEMTASGLGASVEPGVLAETFKLTPTEARVAMEIASGTAPKEISRRLDIMPSTLRTHVKSLLAKTGTHRQSELVSVLLRRATIRRALR